jgi:hypothetical protein
MARCLAVAAGKDRNGTVLAGGFKRSRANRRRLPAAYGRGFFDHGVMSRVLAAEHVGAAMRTGAGLHRLLFIEGKGIGDGPLAAAAKAIDREPAHKAPISGETTESVRKR